MKCKYFVCFWSKLSPINIAYELSYGELLDPFVTSVYFNIAKCYVLCCNIVIFTVQWLNRYAGQSIIMRMAMIQLY